MNITYFLAGLLSGISIASFFVGKELYRFYVRYKIQKKQLERMAKLNDKIKKSIVFEPNEMSN